MPGSRPWGGDYVTPGSAPLPNSLLHSPTMITPAAQLGYYHGTERLRYVGSWAIGALAAIVLGTLGVVISFFAAPGTVAQMCARLRGRTLLWISGIVVESEGSEHLDADAAYVFVANHQSTLDTLALLVALPLPFRSLAKTSLFRIPLVGWTMRRLGYVPDDLGANDSIAKVLSTSRQRSARPISTVVFAEGARTAEGEVARFRSGFVYLARAVGVPIVPVALVNSGHLMPSGRRFADPGSIQVRIGAPMHADPEVAASDIAATARAAVTELMKATAP